MDQTRKVYSISALVMAVCLISAVPVVASDSAMLSLVPEGVNERVVLTINGPGDLTYKQTFAAGSTPSFGLFDETGNLYPNGSYTWELRSAPAKATRTRDKDDRGIAKNARSEALASGYFAIAGGGFVTPEVTEEVRAKADVPTKDQQILDDLIVDGSACIGQDCVNGESFGFDTIRLKENNLRIKFQDTSNSASFPSNDWQLTANDSSNGGVNKFSIDDIDGGRTPFTIEAGAPSHSLYVDDGGRVGFGTSTPVTDLHVKSGNTPTLRLEQDGSSGFTAQTWDVAGNEAGFFVRDATTGSTLPFRIIPGAASQALVIGSNDHVGVSVGTSPSYRLHVRDNDTTDVANFESDEAQTRLILENNSQASEIQWAFSVNGSPDEFRVSKIGSTVTELKLDASGNMTILGSITTGGTTCSGGCDRVFQPGYELESIEEHAAYMWENSYLRGVGPTVENQPFDLTEKTGGMLNELEKAHLYIEQLHSTIKEMESRLQTLENSGR